MLVYIGGGPLKYRHGSYGSCREVLVSGFCSCIKELRSRLVPTAAFLGRMPIFAAFHAERRTNSKNQRETSSTMIAVSDFGGGPM